MPTIKVARPFQINGTDGTTYEYGIGVYDVSDAVADNWYVKFHLQDAVLSRGLGLLQWRVLGGGPLPPDFDPGWLLRYHVMMIWIGTEYSPVYYGTEIEAGWPAIFVDDLDHWPALSLPPEPDFIAVGTDPVTGETLYRPHVLSDRIMRSHHPGTAETPTIRVYPGDPSPPIAAATDDGNVGRAATEEAVHLVMQQAQLRAVQAVTTRYIDAPNDVNMMPWPWTKHTGTQVTPTPPPMDWSRWTYTDPRVGV